MDRALVVMAKEPLAGRTKTRLSPPLSGQEAAELYRCLLLDTLELMRQMESAQSIIAYSPHGAEPFFRRLAPPGNGRPAGRQRRRARGREDAPIRLTYLSGQIYI